MALPVAAMVYRPSRTSFSPDVRAAVAAKSAQRPHSFLAAEGHGHPRLTFYTRLRSPARRKYALSLWVQTLEHSKRIPPD